MIKFRIKLLKQKDWELWKKIRLESLQAYPEAFGSSFDEEYLYTEAEWKKLLEHSTIFGAFLDNQLVAVSGFYIYQPLKMRHKGALFGMYVESKERGKGIADALIKKIIGHARSFVTQIHCSVVTSNKKALKLYQKHGFHIYGTEPKALKVNNDYYDEYLLVLNIK